MIIHHLSETKPSPDLLDELCTANEKQILVVQISLAAYGSQDVQFLNGLSFNNLMLVQ
jgi:hypothetical protein